MAFHNTIRTLLPTDTNHADNFNEVYQQLLENDLSLRSAFSNPNFLINGNSQIWQDGTSFAMVGSFKYCDDMWMCAYAPGCTVLRSTDVPINSLSKYSRRYSFTSVADGGITRQYLEGNGAQFKGKTVTMAFWVKGVSGAYAEFDFCDYPQSMINHQFSGAWEKIEHTFVFNSEYVGTPFIDTMSGRLSIGDFYITDAKFELGSIATPFVPRPDAQELTLCKRYYEIIDYYYGNYCDVAGTILLPINFTEKRVIPSVTYFGWWVSQPGYIHYQPVGQGGTDFLTDVFFNSSKTMVQLYLKTRSNITATPAVGTFMAKNVTIDARIYS